MRKITSLLIALFIAVNIFSQYTGTPNTQLDLSKINLEDFTFGFKVSPSISWVNVEHNDAIADGATMKVGLGIVANYEINSLLSVVSGINYAGVGGYMYDNVSLNDITTKDNYKVNYSLIEVPLGLRLQTPTLNKTSYYLQGGVTTTFILTANEKRKSVLPNTPALKNDILSLTSPSAVGMFAGIGVEFTILPKLRIFTEISYRNSFSSFAMGNNYVNSTDLYHQYTEPIDIKPATMDFSVGIMF